MVRYDGEEIKDIATMFHRGYFVTGTHVSILQVQWVNVKTINFCTRKGVPRGVKKVKTE